MGRLGISLPVFNVISHKGDIKLNMRRDEDAVFDDFQNIYFRIFL